LPPPLYAAAAAVPVLLSGVDVATFDAAVIAVALAAALSTEPGALSVVVDHVTAVTFSLALQGARSLSVPGTRAARSTIALALAVAEQRVELDEQQLRALRRRRVLDTSNSTSMTLSVAVSGLQVSVQAASAIAAAAASPQTAALLAVSLAGEGVSSVAVSVLPTVTLVLAVSSPGVAAALLAAQLTANTAVLDAALHAAGLLAVIIVVAPPQPPPQPPLPLRTSPPPLPPALSTLPPGVMNAPQKPVVLIATVVCAFGGVAACAAGGVCLSRRSARRLAEQRKTRKRMAMPLGWDEGNDHDVQKDADMEAGHSRSAGLVRITVRSSRGRGRTLLERTAIEERARGDVLLHAVSNVVALDDSALRRRTEEEEQEALGLHPLRATSPEKASGRRSQSLPPHVSRVSTPFGEEQRCSPPPPPAAAAAAQQHSHAGL
jgi:hypothetical protein